MLQYNQCSPISESYIKHIQTNWDLLVNVLLTVLIKYATLFQYASIS